MDDFCIGKGDIQPAHGVYRGGQGIEIYRHILMNIQIQIRIQHGNGPFRPADGIGGVRLGIGIISHIHKGIPVKRRQPDFPGCMIHHRHDHGIAVLTAESGIFIPVVDSEKRIGFISAVRLYLGIIIGFLRCLCAAGTGSIIGALCRGTFFHFLIYLDLGFVQRLLIQFIQPGAHLSIKIQHSDNQGQYKYFHGKYGKTPFSVL